MIETASAKSGNVKWKLADVAALPFADATFVGAVCTLAIHHFESLDSVFGEIRRVLKKKNSTFVIFTSLPEQTANYWLAEYFPQAIEKSAAQLPDLKSITAALQNAGFTRIETEPYQVGEDLRDLFLYSGKFNPEMYLNAAFRANISTFSLLADETEINAGCKRLAADIEDGSIRKIIERYKNTDDYLFVIAKT